MTVSMLTRRQAVDPDRSHSLRERRIDCALAVMTGLEKANQLVCNVDSVALFIHAVLDNQTVLPDGTIIQRMSPAQRGRANPYLTESMRQVGVTLAIDPTAPLLSFDSWSR